LENEALIKPVLKLISPVLAGVVTDGYHGSLAMGLSPEPHPSISQNELLMEGFKADSSSSAQLAAQMSHWILQI
jgi:hypothetical protein